MGVVELHSDTKDGQPSAFLDIFPGSIYVTGKIASIFCLINMYLKVLCFNSRTVLAMEFT